MAILEILFNLPGLGPFENVTLEPILGAFFFDSFLQPLLASAEDCVLASEAENWAVIVLPIPDINNLIKSWFMAFQEGL